MSVRSGKVESEYLKYKEAVVIEIDPFTFEECRDLVTIGGATIDLVFTRTVSIGGP